MSSAETSEGRRLRIVRPNRASGNAQSEASPSKSTSSNQSVPNTKKRTEEKTSKPVVRTLDTCSLWDAVENADWCSSRSSSEDEHIAATLKSASSYHGRGCLHPGIRLDDTSICAFDLIKSARFMAYSSDDPFTVGEIVVVPHPRGGFVTAAVDGVVVAPRCCVDPSISHKSIRVRVAYKSASKTTLHTDMPAFLVGRFIDGKPVIKYHRGSSRKMEEQSRFVRKTKPERIVGESLSAIDCTTVRFSAHAVFNVGQIVAVPRSTGGFTYGSVSEKHNTFCTIDMDVTHEVDTWRVETVAGHAFKDLPTAMVGFFPSSDQRPNIQTPDLAFPAVRRRLLIQRAQKKDKRDVEDVKDVEEEEDAEEYDGPEDDLEKIVVIDGVDVGKSFSFDGRILSTGGITKVINFYESLGCDVKVFLPESAIHSQDNPLDILGDDDDDDDDDGSSNAKTRFSIDDNDFVDQALSNQQLVVVQQDDPEHYLFVLDCYCTENRAYPVTNAACDSETTPWLTKHAQRYSVKDFDFVPVSTDDIKS